MITALLVVAVLTALVAGPLLAARGVRIAASYRTPPEGADPERDPAAPDLAGGGTVAAAAVSRAPARPGPARVAAVTAALAALLVGSVLLLGARPLLAGLAWAAGAAVLLAQVDLAVHRLPDRVVYPAAAVVVAAQLADAVVLGSWEELLRALLAGPAAFVLSAAAALVGPGMGFGDVKLLGLLGLLLGWFGWSVLLLGVLLGFLVGALAAVVLVVGRRAGWRTEVALGPSLLTGAVLVLALPAVLTTSW